MNEDATVTVNLALTEIGQGTWTSLRQIVAERLGFPLERIRVDTEKDTDHDPYDWQTVASKGLLLTGNAAILAAEDLLARIYDTAGKILRAEQADLAHDEDGVFIKHRPEKRVRFARFAVGYAYPDGNGIGGPLMGFGKYTAQGLTNIDKETGQGNPALDWTYGAHAIVVEVNPVTGEYRILKTASAYDVGRVINPDLVRGQALGASSRGSGPRPAKATSMTRKAGCSILPSRTTRSPRPRTFRTRSNATR